MVSVLARRPRQSNCYYTGERPPSGPARAPTLRGHGDPVWALAYSPDGTTLVSGADDKTIRLWAMPGDLPQKLSTSHTRPARSADFSPDGKTLVTCGDDNVRRTKENNWSTQ